MKKIITFLILITGIIYTSCLTVNAQTTNFYEGEYIQGIWMNRYNPSNKTTYYQKARFFRQSGTNEFAYCIEPFAFFNGNSIYESTVTPYNLTQDQINRVSLIAHFGYNYKNHTDTKWYAVTQLMIWQASDPSGTYYFTDRLNGNRINTYDNEINEINSLINDYLTKPSINNNTYYSESHNDLVITDTNNVLNNYEVNDERISISNNQLIVSNLEEGEYNLTLTRKDNYYNKPIIFYQSSTSQNLIETGNVANINSYLKIIIQKTNLNITKLDEDSESTTPSGDASLDGAKYELYDYNHYPINQLEIKNNVANLDNLDYGKYFLKEIEAGEGYELDENEYEINISSTQPKIELTLTNKVIKAEVTINKTYGTTNNLLPEENISFNIYNSKQEFIETITTNNEGKTSIILPYGKYKIEQINTTEGYKKISPFDLTIDNNKPKEVILQDYRIEVPNTYSNKNNNSLLNIIMFIMSLIC